MRGKIKHLTAGFVKLCLVLALAMTPAYSIISFAAEAKISFSDPSAMVGNDVTVNMNVTATSGALGGADVVLTYDDTVLEFLGGDNANGGAGSIHLIGTMDSDNTTTFSYNLKFRTLQAGNTSISVSEYEIYDKDVQPVALSHVGNSSVTVTPPATFSTEASLASLKISPGTLSPGFSPEVTSYSANVAGDVNKIAIDANAKDGKAKVVISGNSSLKVGENKVVCKVTAEDGQTVKTYSILVSKAEAQEETTEASESSQEETDGSDTVAAQTGDLTIKVEGVDYKIAASFDESALPEGFETSTASYQGNEIMAGKGIEKGLTLIYLVDGEENGSFFIYEETASTAIPFVSLHVSEKSIIILPPEADAEVPRGLMVDDEIEVNQKMVTGYVPTSSADADYCVLYGMNWKGEKGLYRLDRTEMTIQRYFDILRHPAYLEVANKFNDLLKDYNRTIIIMIGLIVISVVLLIMVICLLLKRRARYDDHYNDFRGKREEEDMTPVKRRRIQQEEKEKKSNHREEVPAREIRDRRPKANAFVDDDFEIQDLDDILSEDEGKRSAPQKQDDNSDEDFELIDLD